MRNSSLLLLLACGVALGVGCGDTTAQAPATGKEPPKPPPVTLKIGSPVPALKVTKWLNGAAVPAFEKDKAYVVEFWATWCGPCVAAMPHLGELAAEYKAKGLTVIGVTTKDENGNTADAVAKFVEKNGPKFGYVYAFCETDDTNKAFMEAAGQNGIPCSFVVGKDGTVAYIGHPMNLDEVLPKVLDGTWKGQADADAIVAAEKKLDDIMAGFEAKGAAAEKLGADKKDPAAKRDAMRKAGVETLAALDEYVKAYPGRAKQDQFVMQRLFITLLAADFDAVKAHAEGMIAAAEKGKKVMLAGMVAQALSDKELNPDRKHLDLAEKALGVALTADTPDARAFVTAAQVSVALGKKEQAADYGNKAVEAGASADEKKAIKEFIDSLLKDAK